MDSIKTVFACAACQIRKQFSSIKTYIIIALVALVMLHALLPLHTFSELTGYNITPWTFPLLLSNFSFQFIIYLLIVFLFSDAPFLEADQLFVLQRTGRRKWVISQIIFVFLSTALFFLIVYLISIIIILPNIEFSEDWGKILGTVMSGNAAEEFGISMLSNSPRIMLLYTPIEATLRSFLLSWLCGSFIGCFMFFVNLWTNKAVGIVLGSTIATGHFIIYNLLPWEWTKFSPVSLANIAFLEPEYHVTWPDITYAGVFLVALNIAAIVLCVVFARKIRISLHTK